jgi:hypothetical protein
VLQASEGGPFSVGNQKFKIKANVTPPPVVTPASVTPLEGTPAVVRARIPTERMARVPSNRFSTLAAATDGVVVSKNVLIGLCLTAFAGGIVTTLAVDRIRARAAEPAGVRDPQPVVLETTPLPDPPAAATPPKVPAAPVAQAAPVVPPAPVVQAAPVAPAVDPVVVKLPPASESMTAPAKTVRPLAMATSHLARQVTADPVRPVAAHKKTGAHAASDPTEAAPDDSATDGPLPAPVKKKWVDPFDP